VVEALENREDLGDPDATAHELEQMYANQKDADQWKSGETGDIAGKSNQLAHAEVYQHLRIPVEPCEREVHSCAHAPEGPVELDDAYMSEAAIIAGRQLAKAGFRLADLSNGIWANSIVIRSCALAR